MLKNYLTKLIKNKTTRKSQNFIDISSFNAGHIGTTKAGASSYRNNVIVYRCVNLIAQSASHVPWLVIKNRPNNKTILKDHPIAKLLKNPNAETAGADFFCEVIASLLLFGNAYILSTAKFHSFPQELYLLSANATSPVIQNNIATGYRYNSSAGSKLYPIDVLSKMSKVLHLKMYHPTDKYHGLSCLEAASMSIDLHNQATSWNNSLLRNGARPSGALIVKDSNGYLSDEQFERLQEQLYDKFTGSLNSGKPILLEGGLDWREMSMNPKDMDFIESKNSAAREIALAFGVPPQLLGINGDNTYSNMQEARLALWEETLIPLLDKLSDALSTWLSHWYGEDLHVDFDRDAISALTEKRENLWSKIATANFMTINEKRALVGLEPIKGGNSL